MDHEKHIKRSKRIVNILFACCCAIIGIMIMSFVYFETLSPAQLFVNDTDTAVSAYLIGGTSPGVRLHVEPGTTQLIDMPFWWGSPSLPDTVDGNRVKPRWNFYLLKIYYLSDFPERW